MTQEGSIILVYNEGVPNFYARIEEIKPDVKPNWYKVVIKPFFMIPETKQPADNVEWILRDVYIDGEPFTMGGKDIQFVEIPPVYPPNFQQEQEEVEEIKEEDKEEPTKYLNKLVKQPVVDLGEYRKVKEQVFGGGENNSA